MAQRKKAAVRYTIDELCEVYLNEDVHTEHVTHLALTLFDAVRPWTEMSNADRRLLEAAARLHDVGYAMNPRNHVQGSVDILQEHGVEGFQAGQLDYILAAIALHPNAVKSVMKSARVRGLPHPLRALRLGAILRIADGLDQSHVQDARIRGVRREGNRIVVTVCSPLSPMNLVRADVKASLWRDVFPFDIRFEPDPARESRSYTLLEGGENAYEALRRHAYVQYKIMRGNEEGVKEAVSPEPLHDFRVAARRFRALVQCFKKPLKKTWAADIDRRLQSVALALGAARDFDVWLARLQQLESEQDLSRSRVWKRYMEHQSGFQEGHRARVRQVLGGARYRNLTAEMAYFLRVQLSESVKESAEWPIEPYAADQLARRSKAIFESDVPGGSWEVEDFHDLRKACRRVRYSAEFFGGVLGPRTRQWGRTLKAMADALGDLHDADVGLERVAYEAVSAPRALVSNLREQRARALRDVDRVWAELKSEERYRALRKEWKKYLA